MSPVIAGGFLRDPDGALVVRDAGGVLLAPSASSRNVIQPTGPTVVPLTVKCAAGQTANLQEWQSSAGSILSKLFADGSMQTPILYTDNVNPVAGDCRFGAGIQIVPLASRLSWGNPVDVSIGRSAANTLALSANGILISDPQTSQASLTTARVGGAAAALPAAPVKYLALRDETGARVYVPAYS